jgi:hypothetical protein
MKFIEPSRWILFLSVVTGIGLSIYWGLPFDRGWHFYGYRDWVWPGLVLTLAFVVGGALWLFYVHFPCVLHRSKFVSHIFAAVIFLSAFAAVWGLVLGINMIGVPLVPTELTGTITDVKTLKSKSVPSYDRQVAVVQVDQGPQIEMPIRVLNNLHVEIAFEGKICVFLQRGNLLYWGWVKSPPCMMEDRKSSGKIE